MAHPCRCTSPSPSTAPAGTRPPGASPSPARPSCSPPATGPTWSPRPSAACSTSSPSRTPSACSRPAPTRARRPHRPGPRPARRRARSPPASRPLTRHIGLRADRHVDAHRAVPPRQGPRHARLRQHAAAPAGASRSSGRPDEARALRPPHVPPLSSRPHRPGRRRAGRRPVRRGRRLRRGGPAAVGQLGGRRRDPRRRHRPVRRPRQAALHRLRGPLFSVKGPSIVPRPPQGQPVVAALAHSADPVRVRRPLRPTSCSSRRPTPAPTPRPSSPRSAAPGRRRPRGRAAARVRRPGRVPRRHRRRRRGRPQGAARRAGRARRTPATPSSFTGTAARAGRPAAGLAARPGLTGFRLRPGVICRRPRRHHRRPRARAAAPRRVPHARTRPSTLRELLGLPRPANRYATV